MTKIYKVFVGLEKGIEVNANSPWDTVKWYADKVQMEVGEQVGIFDPDSSRTLTFRRTASGFVQVVKVPPVPNHLASRSLWP